MLNNIKPGSNITITVTKSPTTKSTRETIRRLLLSSVEYRQITAKASQRRTRTADWRPRAGRLWNNRPKVARLFLARVGESSTIQYRPQLMNDIASVSDYISVESA